MSGAIPARRSLAAASSPLAWTAWKERVFASFLGHPWRSSTPMISAGVTRVLEKYRPVAVVHFAAYAYVGESVTNPLHLLPQ